MTHDDSRRDPLRVLIVIKVLGRGGAEQLLLNAAKIHDPALVHLDLAYVVHQDQSFVDEFNQTNAELHWIGSFDGRPWTWVRALARLIRSGYFDIVHVHSPLPGSVARIVTWSIPKSKRPKVVTTEHLPWYGLHPLTRLVNRLTIRRDDKVIAVSEEARASFPPWLRERATVVVHGVPIEAIQENRAKRADVRDELGLSEDEFVIGCVAVMKPAKNYPSLIEAFTQLAQFETRARLVIVGDGPESERVEQLVADSGYSQRVLQLGRRSDVPRLMSAFDCFSLASIYEGFPVAVMEALASGLPIVATDVSGLRDRLTGETAAILVPCNDPTAMARAWRSLAIDDHLRSSMGASSLLLARDYDIRRAVSELEEVYGEIIGDIPLIPDTCH